MIAWEDILGIHTNLW